MMKEFVKEEAKNITRFSKEFDVPEKSKGKFNQLIKRITFLQSLYFSTQDPIYEYVLSDSMYFLDSIKQKRHRYGYMFSRAIIENLMKLLLNLDYKDKMFMKDSVDENQQLQNINSIYGIYKTASNYIHGFNLDSEDIATNYYQISNSKSSNSDINSLISQQLNIYDYFIQLIIEYKSDVVSDSFTRKNSLLKFLVGDKLYKVYRES